LALDKIRVVVRGIQGLSGPAGPPGTGGGSGGATTVSKTNSDTVPLEPGSPVYLFSTTGVKLARANAADSKAVLGFVGQSTAIAPGASGLIQTDGVLVLLQSQWDAVVADPEGWVVDQQYYLSTFSGQLTRTPPSGSGQYVCPIGYSASLTELLIRVDLTILL
jgi:hypothetical protein